MPGRGATFCPEIEVCRPAGETGERFDCICSVVGIGVAGAELLFCGAAVFWGAALPGDVVLFCEGFPFCVCDVSVFPGGAGADAGLEPLSVVLLGAGAGCVTGAGVTPDFSCTGRCR